MSLQIEDSGFGMIQWEDNEEKREEKEQQGPKAGKCDRSMNRSSVTGREECCCRTIITVCYNMYYVKER